MNFLAIIPARYASTRFPGKPLARLGGKPVIQRVYEQVAGVLDDAVVATDDERIRDAVRAFGGRVEMTSPDHRSGTDRCWEAYCKQGREYDVVVNVQGDEPFIHPSQLEAVKRCFDDPATDIATLVKPFTEADGPRKSQLAQGGPRRAVAGHLFFPLGDSLPAGRSARRVARAPHVLQAYRALRLSRRRAAGGDGVAAVAA